MGLVIPYIFIFLVFMHNYYILFLPCGIKQAAIPYDNKFDICLSFSLAFLITNVIQQ